MPFKCICQKKRCKKNKTKTKKKTNLTKNQKLTLAYQKSGIIKELGKVQANIGKALNITLPIQQQLQQQLPSNMGYNFETQLYNTLLSNNIRREDKKMNDAEDKLLMELRGLSRSFDKNSSENFKHSSDMLDYLKGKMEKKPKKGVKIEVKTEHKYDDSHQLPLDSKHPFYHASSSSSSSSLDKPFASSSAFNRPNFEINFDDEPHFPTSDYVVESAKKHNKRNRVQMPDNPSSRTLPESSSQDFSSDLLRIVNFIESMGPPHKWTNENKDELERFVEEGMSNLQTKSQQTQFLNTFQKELQRYKIVDLLVKALIMVILIKIFIMILMNCYLNILNHIIDIHQAHQVIH